MRRQVLVVVSVCAAIGSIGLAQGLSFEAISIKRRPDSAVDRTLGVRGNRFRSDNASVRMLIGAAFSDLGLQGAAQTIPAWRIVGGPGWIDTDGYDIDAVAPAAATPDAILAMVRTMLVERFRMRAHEETQEQPIYALVVARRDGQLGPELKPSTATTASGSSRPGQLSGVGRTMDDLRRNLQSMLGRTIVNDTGLAGQFDYAVRYTPKRVADEPLLDDASAASLLTALQEQLGLKLESRRGPARVIAIDSIERPTEN